MKTLTQIVLTCLFSASLFAQGSFCVQEYKIGYNAQKSKEKVIPAIGVTINSDYLKKVSFILAYADSLFMKEEQLDTEDKIKNIYFTLSYNF
jgi:hypothetical protein